MDHHPTKHHGYCDRICILCCWWCTTLLVHCWISKSQTLHNTGTKPHMILINPTFIFDRPKILKYTYMDNHTNWPYHKSYLQVHVHWLNKVLIHAIIVYIWNSHQVRALNTLGNVLIALRVTPSRSSTQYPTYLVHAPGEHKITYCISVHTLLFAMLIHILYKYSFSPFVPSIHQLVSFSKHVFSRTNNHSQR